MLYLLIVQHLYSQNMWGIYLKQYAVYAVYTVHGVLNMRKKKRYVKISIDEETYYKLIMLKSIYRQKTWSDLINYIFLKKDLIKDKFV